MIINQPLTLELAFEYMNAVLSFHNISLFVVFILLIIATIQLYELGTNKS